MSAFQSTQAIYVATRLGVADLLPDGPKSAEELAQDTGTHGPSLSRLLRVLATYGVFAEVAPRQFAVTSLGPCLRADAPHAYRDTVLMWGSPYYGQATANLLHCVQTGESAVSHLFGTTTTSFEHHRTHPQVGAMGRILAGLLAPTGRWHSRAVK